MINCLRIIYVFFEYIGTDGIVVMLTLKLIERRR